MLRRLSLIADRISERPLAATLVLVGASAAYWLLLLPALWALFPGYRSGLSHALFWIWLVPATWFLVRIKFRTKKAER